MPFVDVEAEECIEHVSDKEKEAIKTIGIFTEVLFTVSTLTTLNVLILLWTLICESNFLLYFHLCPKVSIFEVFTMPPSIHFSNLITLFSCMVVFHSIYIYLIYSRACSILGGCLPFF